MKSLPQPFLLLLLILAGTMSLKAQDSPKLIHVFVALCDNLNQGIVPVPAAIGNGQKPSTNLYWGAGYGVKTYFHRKTSDWVYQGTLPSGHPDILERIWFKHRDQDVWMVADAYDGAAIQTCITDFLLAANGQDSMAFDDGNLESVCGKLPDLVAYVGHDGLMEFSVDPTYQKPDGPKPESIMFACFSQSFFKPEIELTGSQPLVWTTNLMAPEAYILHAAIGAWLRGEPADAVVEATAQAYHKYQKCGIRGARNLFVSGW
ncbi:hypothetical protein [Pontibacter sp. G13]|uniref:hypothetical protein n=1 Tax=Pontibacter sp. G13 TaxID=3074898 RepID=UPI002889AB8D|nr:hypothetical protein [Pontibacter sp. G13]WNJ18380.1 hypothetical protein RJD25_26295 [Pontibacter sp. G13]